MARGLLIDKPTSELQEQLALAEDLLGQPLWLGEDVPGVDIIEDLKADYPAKFEFYLRVLRAKGDEGAELLTDSEQVALEIINNFERTYRRDFEFVESDIKLFDYQQELFVSIGKHLQSGASQGWAKLPTGYGKSIVGAALSAAVEVPTVIVVPRLPLATDAVEALQKLAPDRKVTQFNGNEKDVSGDTVVVLAPSLANFVEAAKAAGRTFPVAFLDEAHLLLTDLKQSTIDQIPGCVYQLAVTATPVYSTTKSVGIKFGDEVYSMTLPEGIELGILSPIFPGYLDIDVDLSNVRVSSKGVYNEKDLEAAIGIERLCQIATAAIKGTPFEKQHGVIFVPSVAASKAVAKTLRAKGIKAKAAHGGLKDIDEIQETFERGDLQVLVTPQLLTIGWDSRRVDYALDLSPSGSWVDKEQRVGRLARKSVFTNIKTYLELVAKDTKKRFVSASMILGNRSDLVPKGTLKETINKHQQLMESLKEAIKLEGLKVVVTQVEQDQLTLERTQSKGMLTEEIARSLLEALPMYVRRDLQRARTETFLGYRFDPNRFSGTGRSLVRRYFTEVLEEPLTAVDDASVYRLIQSLIPEMGRFNFLEEDGTISPSSLFNIFKECGIDNAASFSLLGRVGLMQGKIKVGDIEVTGQFLCAALSRNINQGKASSKWADQYKEVFEHVFPDQQELLDSETLLQMSREKLRETFSSYQWMINHSFAKIAKVLDHQLEVFPGVFIKASHLIQTHLELLTGEPVPTVRTTQLYKFFADIFPELTESLDIKIQKIEQQVTRMREATPEDAEKTRQAAFEDIKQSFAAAGYATKEPYDTYGPSVMIAAQYEDDSGSKSGFGLLQKYRRLVKIHTRKGDAQAITARMVDDLFETDESTQGDFGVEHIRKFLTEAGYTPEMIAEEPLAALLRKSMTVDGITTTLERLIRVDEYMTGALHYFASSLQVKDAKKWLENIFPEIEVAFHQKLLERRNPAALRKIEGSLEFLTEEERQLLLSAGRRSFRDAKIEANTQIITGTTLFDAVELTLNRKRIFEKKQEQTEEKVPVKLVRPRRLSPREKLILQNEKFDETLHYLFPNSYLTLPEALGTDALDSYLRSKLLDIGFNRDQAVKMLISEFMQIPLVEGHVSVPAESFLMTAARVRHPLAAKIESVNQFLENIMTGVTEERSRYWTAATLEALKGLGITDCVQFFHLGVKQFFHQKFDVDGREMRGMDLAIQMLGRNVYESAEFLNELGARLFPKTLTKGLLYNLVREGTLMGLFSQLSRRSLEDLKGGKYLEASDMKTFGFFAGVKISDVREALENAKILKPDYNGGGDITRRDLRVILNEVVRRTNQPSLVQRYERRRAIVRLESKGVITNLFNEYIDSKNPNFNEFERRRYAMGEVEFSGREVLSVLGIKSLREFHEKVQERKQEKLAKTSLKERSDKKTDKKEEEEVLYLDPKFTKLNFAQAIVKELIEQYNGETDQEFNRTKFTITQVARNGATIKQLLIQHGMLTKSQPITIETLRTMIDVAEFTPTTSEYLRTILRTIEILNTSSKPDLLKILNSASKQISFGAGNEAHKKWNKEYIRHPSGQLSGMVLARFIETKYEVDVGKKDWLIKLLPKVMKK